MKKSFSNPELSKKIQLSSSSTMMNNTSPFYLTKTRKSSSLTLLTEKSIKISNMPQYQLQKLQQVIKTLLNKLISLLISKLSVLLRFSLKAKHQSYQNQDQITKTSNNTSFPSSKKEEIKYTDNMILITKKTNSSLWYLITTLIRSLSGVCAGLIPTLSSTSGTYHKKMAGKLMYSLKKLNAFYAQ